MKAAWIREKASKRLLHGTKDLVWLRDRFESSDTFDAVWDALNPEQRRLATHFLMEFASHDGFADPLYRERRVDEILTFLSALRAACDVYGCVPFRIEAEIEELETQLAFYQMFRDVYRSEGIVGPGANGAPRLLSGESAKPRVRLVEGLEATIGNAASVHMQDFENHYRPALRRDGTPISLVDDRMCRALPNGLPDYSDPEIFPVL